MTGPGTATIVGPTGGSPTTIRLVATGSGTVELAVSYTPVGQAPLVATGTVRLTPH